MSAQTSIADVLAQLYIVEAALAVTEVNGKPLRRQMEKTWPYVPPQSQVISSTPCTVHSWTPTAVAFGSSGMRINYAVHCQLLIAEAQADQAAHIAAAFLQPLINALSANIKFGLSEWSVLTLRFNGPQPVLIAEATEAAGKALVGLDYFIDLQHNYSQAHAVGAAPPS